MPWRWFLAFLVVSLAGPAACAEAGPVLEAGREHRWQATTYSPLATNRELARRLFTPLTARKLIDRLDEPDSPFSEHPVDLAKEHFVLWLPSATPPPGGYGLLVYVPPVDSAALPHDWASVLRRHDLVYISPENAGNRHSVSGRRIPLALHAHEAARHRLPINPERVFVAGYSGGSRTAAWLAMAFPDIFRGAVLNAGSDPFGHGAQPIPPRELFQRFQRESRVVMVTGSDDLSYRLLRDRRFRESARRFCVGGVWDRPMSEVGHRLMDGHALGRALALLVRPAETSIDADCEAGLAGEVDAALARVSALLESGDAAAAGKELEAIDAAFGGLAAPRSLALAERALPEPAR